MLFALHFLGSIEVSKGTGIYVLGSKYQFHSFTHTLPTFTQHDLDFFAFKVMFVFRIGIPYHFSPPFKGEDWDPIGFITIFSPCTFLREKIYPKLFVHSKKQIQVRGGFQNSLLRGSGYYWLHVGL